MLCEACKTNQTHRLRLYGPPNLCRQCRESRVTPVSTALDDVRLGECRLPRRWWVINSEQPAVSKVAKLVDIAWNKDCGLLMEGPVGVGKTLAAAMLVHRLLERNASCLFLSVPDTVDLLRNSQGDTSLISRMKTVQHLILDDLGAEYDKSGWWFSQLYQVVNDRYENNRPMTATCNQFKAIEPRILRRIADLSHVVSMERA